MDRVLGRELAIDAIEDIELIALGVKDDELGRIEETAVYSSRRLQ